jgi:hypothetical protein
MCQNGGVCHPQNGTCACPPGYTGDLCEMKCQVGLYGLGCRNPCMCSNNSLSCDHVTGQCNCRLPWRGKSILYDFFLYPFYSPPLTPENRSIKNTSRHFKNIKKKN